MDTWYDAELGEMTAYSVEEINLENLFSGVEIAKKRKNRKWYRYANMPIAFDIETTTIGIDKFNELKKTDKDIALDSLEAFIYHWQICFDKTVIFGRRIEEAIQLFSDLQKLPFNVVIYIHNLSYEFQWLQDYMKFDNIFARQRHTPIYAISGNIEFRCSLIMSNMGLKAYTQKYKVKYSKREGEKFDYKKIRTPAYEMTAEEKTYCYCDVAGLCECLAIEFKENNVCTIPLTSTGFVRKDCLEAMNKNPNKRKIVKSCALNLKQYNLCKRAYRGGNTHANRYRAEILQHDVQSWDRSSSYPSVIMSYKYPYKFREVPEGRFYECFDLVNENSEDLFYIADFCFVNLRIKEDCYNPYLTKAKMFNKFTDAEVKSDNGRILSASEYITSLTEVDYLIVESCYDFDKVLIANMYWGKKEFLPLELRQQVYHYYYLKTTLKNGDPVQYMKSKNKLNGIYGMMCTDILADSVTFENGEWFMKEMTIEDKEKSLASHFNNRRTFLAYQWGVWVCAYGRLELEKSIKCVGEDYVYGDTDSCKCVGDHTADIERINKGIRERNSELDLIPIVEYNGKTYEMGVYENDENYDLFITKGSKKYLTVTDGKYHVTVSGLNKEKGSKYFQEHGIEAFKDGTAIADSGRTCAYYMTRKPHKIVVENCEVTSGSCIVIIDVSYTFSSSKDYRTLLDEIQECIWNNIVLGNREYADEKMNE